MTQLEVLFRYERHPAEGEMTALGNLREVYGIRRIQLDEEWKTIRVEFDATRLNSDTVMHLLRRGGIDVVERLPLILPQEVPPAVPA